MKKEKKRVSQSKTEHVQIVLDAHSNGLGRLFGGRLMEWIDTVATVVARRHAGTEVVTVTVDHLEFKAPAQRNSTIVLIGEITYTGKTSVEVRVDTYVEQLCDMQRQLVNRAYLVYVALDEQGKPTEVPGLLLETSEQKALYREAEKRQENRKKQNL